MLTSPFFDDNQRKSKISAFSANEISVTYSRKFVKFEIPDNRPKSQILTRGFRPLNLGEMAPVTQIMTMTILIIEKNMKLSIVLLTDIM
jgi:hypothetical protein